MSDFVFVERPCQPATDADQLALIMARVEKNDPAAINHLGDQHSGGFDGLHMDVQKAQSLVL